MLGLGPIAFATPWMLAALIVLPVLWWLLRVTPPSPRVIRFPAIRLLRDLAVREETPARTPLWLLILRVVAAGLIILALAGPLLHPNAGMPGSGPILLVIDNGWAAARDWPARQRAMEGILAQAERGRRPVMVLATAPAATGEKPTASGALRPADARRLVQTLQPQPWPSDHKAALEAVRTLEIRGAAHTVWLGDGVAGDGAVALADRLRQIGSLEVLIDGADRLPHLLLQPEATGQALTARAVRADPAMEEVLTVRLSAADGRLLAREPLRFAAGARTAETRMNLPVELRNQGTRLAIENETTAAAGVLLDARWRRRPVGLVSGRPDGENQPLLSDLHYLEQALTPYSEVRRGSIADLLKRDLAVLILSDIGSLTGEETEALETWVRRGGVLVRFAGPRLAQNADALVPVRLRLGDRTLGGAMSWSEPARLAPFDARSPFAGLAIPGDVSIERQVLAEPSLDIADKTWARLADGTPLVTAEKRGTGHVVLVHTTASPDWSNLSLSGLFVEMLRRTMALSEGVAGPGSGSGGTASAPLDPIETMDGLGRLTPPPTTAFPIPRDAFGPQAIGPRHPPGFYGTDEARRALNLTALITDIAALRNLPAGVERHGYQARGEVDLKPWLLGAAMALATIDLLLALALRGLLGRALAPGRRRTVTAAGLLLGMLGGAAMLALPVPAAAQSGIGDEAGIRDGKRALEVTADTHLAYVETGDPGIDDVSRAGLIGLSEVLNRRTAVESAGAAGVDIERDELSFYPLLYWAISPSQPPLSDAAKTRINDYLRNGGTILFDTRDQGMSGGLGGGPGGARLQELVDGLDIPALAPVQPDHVLTKAFYLMQDFPGRHTGGDIWVEAREERQRDGVSSVIIGANDWAGAWAVDENGRPRFAVVPGGEKQREMAYRFGVNVVMYALTGNYKADQVHVPAILERLGQ